jgi:hypothetical protein
VPKWRAREVSGYLPSGPGRHRDVAAATYDNGFRKQFWRGGWIMPFVYDQTEVEWPEDDSDPPPPKADEFVYLPPPEFGGAAEPVRFSAEASGPQESGRDQMCALVVSELRAIGARRAYGRYDGGNDEGFAWLDSVETQAGRVDAAALAETLLAGPLLEKACPPGLLSRSDRWSKQEQLRRFVLDRVCDEWASMLLGRGYGTGEYSMYGAFTVDLEACTITDDREADPVVQNIEIAK